MKVPKATVTGLALVFGVLVACGGPGVASTEVEMGEFWVRPGDRVLQAGSVEVIVENSGDFPHTLVVSDDSGTVIGATDLIGSEATTVLTVDLVPGSYSFTCRIVRGLDDGTFVDHYQRGMTATVNVSA